jgi:hypothetical protein
MAEKVLTKEEMLRRINYAMAHTSLETADKYGFKSADAADRNIQRYAMAISNKPKIRCKLSDAEKKEMVEYYITHSGAETANLHLILGLLLIAIAYLCMFLSAASADLKPYLSAVSNEVCAMA